MYTHHTHNACEIYINISGNVNFMVEDKIYPISPGSVIMTRPYEYHHCIYNDNSPHEHFWILFTADGNEDLFDNFFKRKKGEENLLQFHGEDAETLLGICRNLSEKQTSAFSNYCNFFELIKLLSYDKADTADTSLSSPSLTEAVRYINQNLSSRLYIEDIAKNSFVSVNTLERQFKKHIGISPSQFIREKKLMNAASLLRSGYSVQSSAEKSGFSDYSNFIGLFKKYYGVTPFKFKKQNISL